MWAVFPRNAGLQSLCRFHSLLLRLAMFNHTQTNHCTKWGPPVIRKLVLWWHSWTEYSWNAAENKHPFQNEQRAEIDFSSKNIQAFSTRSTLYIYLITSREGEGWIFDLVLIWATPSSIQHFLIAVIKDPRPVWMPLTCPGTPTQCLHRTLSLLWAMKNQSQMRKWRSET